MLDLEVLIGELLAVDGLATSAVATGEVTTLEHELGDDTVEGRALVSETLVALAQLHEVLGGLWDDVVVEVEVNSPILNFMMGTNVSHCLSIASGRVTRSRRMEGFFRRQLAGSLGSEGKRLFGRRGQ